MSNEIPIEIDIQHNITNEQTHEETVPQTEIACVNVFDISYGIFYAKYMLHNLPCSIKNMSNNWKCSKEWIVEDRINYDYFIQEYGDLDAPVADCDQINFNAQCKCNMKVKDYMSYLRTQYKEKLLYLKDWHLKRLTNELFYDVPILFASDWLNEYALDNKEDDFMFVYIGPKDTWTPLHADVYSSYSWSVNVIGRKKWIMLPPGEEVKLRDAFGNLPLLFDPKIHKNVKYFEIIQERGDGIFVPSGWHHQVFNVLDTISINHNFINACNVEFVWRALQENLVSVEKEIKEFQGTPDFTPQCQLILKSVFGMDFASFIKFIVHIAQKRINHLDGKLCKLFNTYSLQKNHVIFDLYIILKIINFVENQPLKSSVILQSLVPQLLHIKNSINKVL
ncbi:2-oxoglutarate and iron-dependent oxygenase JMJD4 homolog [Maniola hyperantus]|uniref:2-oxoglutarate and iron-dependent oxygenase JMJD4 homolog n=1 Tax=Aphantopus hyperantus TaxID=2795564 RepID=UPI001569227F|nr:2-oxoglutarate and iron-dependent oxygenase JMJD4 homolog [Maniola hyperantus]